MTSFVVGGCLFVVFLDDFGFSFKAHINFVLGIFKILHGQFFMVTLGCQEGCLVNQIFKVCT